jgi:hypothetical protein
MTGGQSAVRVNDRHSFPVGGLVELSQATYRSTPLAVVEIFPTVFSFIGAGGTATAVGGSQECALIDTGYGRAFLKYAAPSPGLFTNRLAGPGTQLSSPGSAAPVACLRRDANPYCGGRFPNSSPLSTASPWARITA